MRIAVMRSPIGPLLFALLLGCGAGDRSEAVPGIGAKTYLSNEYFQKQRDCEARPPRTHSELGVTDYGDSLQEAGKPAEWKSQRIYLGETCYFASVGPVYYLGSGDSRPAYYSIDVEARVKGQSASDPPSYKVLFRRDISIAVLPTGFESVDIGEIVTFSNPEGVVRFKIGKTSHEYRLAKN